MASAEGRVRELFQGTEERRGGGASTHRGFSCQRRLLPDGRVGVQPLHRVQTGPAPGFLPEMDAPDRPLEVLFPGGANRTACQGPCSEAGR